MTEEKLAAVELEIERPRERIEKLRQERIGKTYWNFPKESGAVRRSSMDLSRALSALRKPE